MSFLPSRTVFEEKIVDNYDITTGNMSYVSSNISDMSIVSLQIIATNLKPNNDVELSMEQSNDGINFDDIPNSTIVIDGNISLTVERSNFSGKYIRITFLHAPDDHVGNVSVILIAKR